MRSGTSRERGFTLIELLMTIAVFAVLMAIAVPSFKNVALRSNIRSIANELNASSYLARSEAIKRNRTVRLCPSTDGVTCDGTAWSNGWIVLVPRPDGTACPSTDNSCVVQRRVALPKGFTVIASASPVIYQATGYGATSATLKVCRNAPLGNEERVVTVEVSGKSYVSRSFTGVCS